MKAIVALFCVLLILKFLIYKSLPLSSIYTSFNVPPPSGPKSVTLDALIGSVPVKSSANW